MNKRSYKIIGYLLIATILAFLFNHLISNWQKVSQYEFSFNIFLFVLSVLAYSLVLILLSLIWRKIIVTIEGEHKLSKPKAMKIYMLSEFGKYLPGKVWSIFGRIYLGSLSGISKRTLLVASSIDALLAPITTILVGTLALLIFLGLNNSPLYIISLFIVGAGALFLHPKILYPSFNFVIRKVGRDEIENKHQLNYSQITQLSAYYILIALASSLCFVLFVTSITKVSIIDIPNLIASFTIAKGLGTAALFAPSGLGVREAIISITLGFGNFAAISVFVSILARLWSTVAETLALGFSYLVNYLIFPFPKSSTNTLVEK
jgi:glycosyltransferase 2 family protein